MKFGLKERTIKTINSIFEKYVEVEKVVLYGSRAMGNYKDGSDIDLAMVGKSLNDDILSKIKNDLEDSWLPYKFDISIFKKISNSSLVNHINRVGVVFYKK